MSLLATVVLKHIHVLCDDEVFCIIKTHRYNYTNHNKSIDENQMSQYGYFEAIIYQRLVVN